MHDYRRWAVLLGAFSAALTVHPFYETDIYWHLALGRAVLRQHARVVAEPMALDWAGTTCVASEWLWEVLAALLHRTPGAFAPLAVLTALCGAASAAFVVALCVASWRRDEAAPSTAAVALASSLALSLVLSRLRLRPESAVMVLLPAFALLALRHLRALEDDARRPWHEAAGLVALQVFWAQVHPTFVLGAALWGALAAPTVFHALRARDASARRTLSQLALVAVALAVALTTSAHGLNIVTQWRAHARGDAVRHIADMQSPPADYFDPRKTTYGAFFATLVALGVVGMVAARRVFVREALLALPGLALAATAVRGVGPGAILVAPLAARGADALMAWLSQPGRNRVTFTLAAVVMALTVSRTVDDEGPLGVIGPRPASMPHASARFLAVTAPAGTAALTSFLSGAPIGYWLGGRVRTLIDSRTPMHFTDAEYGRARDLWRVPRALDLAVARYNLTVAVVDRDGPECPLLAAHPAWRPVVAEASFTTFVRANSAFDRVAPLTRIAPCGASHLTANACDDHGASLAAELTRLRALGARQAAGFYDYLDVARIMRCSAEGAPVAALLARMPSQREAYPYRAQRNRLVATLLGASDDVDGALDLLDDDVRRGDLESAAVAVRVASRSRADRVRGLLTALSRTLDDNTPGDLRGELAALCADAREPECARVEGFRAAVLGSPRAGRALCWLATQHPLAHVRRDARGWLQTLRGAMPEEARLRCEAP